MNERTCENLLQGDTADLHEALHAAFSALGIARVVRGARALAQQRPQGATNCFLALAYGELLRSAESVRNWSRRPLFSTASHRCPPSSAASLSCWT